MMIDDDAQAAGGWRRLLLPAEAISLAVIALIVAIDAALSAARAIPVDTGSFAPNVLFAFALLGLAVGYRSLRRSERIPLALIGCAILILFTNAGAVLNYLVVPVGGTTIDPLLARADRALGFDWSAFAEWAAGRPRLASLLAFIYLSSLGQIAAVLILLGLTGRQQSLHRFLACGMLASLVSIAIWAWAPSIGPAAWPTSGPGPLLRDGSGMPPKGLLGLEDAAQLQALLRSGPAFIRADQLLGLIAFPSMHTVMLAIVLYYTRGSRAFVPFAVLNLPMIPAILLSGGHHLVDVLGGLALFAAAAAISAHLLRPGRAPGEAPAGVPRAARPSLA